MTGCSDLCNPCPPPLTLPNPWGQDSGEVLCTMYSTMVIIYINSNSLRCCRTYAHTVRYIYTYLGRYLVYVYICSLLNSYMHAPCKRALAILRGYWDGVSVHKPVPAEPVPPAGPTAN